MESKSARINNKLVLKSIFIYSKVNSSLQAAEKFGFEGKSFRKWRDQLSELSKDTNKIKSYHLERKSEIKIEAVDEYKLNCY